MRQTSQRNRASPAHTFIGIKQAVKGRMNASRSVVIGTVSVVAVIALWQLLSTFHIISPLFFSSPLEVAGEAVEELGSPVFWAPAAHSAYEFALGYGIAVVVGLPLGLLNGWNRTFSYLADPWLSFFYTLPRIALTPLLLITFGIGTPAIVAVVFLGAIFEIVLNTSHGARIVDQNHLDVAKCFGASRIAVMLQIVVPTSVPFMIVGLRLGVGRALIGVVIGELFVGATGLGHNLFLASQTLDTAKVLFVVMFFLVVALVMTAVLRRAELYFSSWRTDIGTTI